MKSNQAIVKCATEARRSANSTDFKLRDHYYRYFGCLFTEFNLIDPASLAVKQEAWRLLLNGTRIGGRFVDNIRGCFTFNCIAKNCNITINRELNFTGFNFNFDNIYKSG